MNHRLRTLTTFLFAVAVIAFSPSAAEPQNSGQDPFSSVEDFQREFQSVPCKTKDRLPAVRSLHQVGQQDYAVCINVETAAP